jgi:hypothetical protein
MVSARYAGRVVTGETEIDMNMTEQEFSTLDDARRHELLCAALAERDAACYRLAVLKVGEAIAQLQKVKPDAAQIRFRVERTEECSAYVVVHTIDGQGADNVLFDLNGDGADDVDTQDELVVVEDYLAGAIDDGYRFEPGARGGERVLDLPAA